MSFRAVIIALLLLISFPLGCVMTYGTGSASHENIGTSQVIPPTDPPSSSSTSPAGGSKTMSYTPHSPIIINGNADLIVGMNGVVSGSGTIGDPYIISGWEFNTSVYNTQISINDTFRYLIIRDCYIHNENYSRTPLGICLQDVWHATIENNTFCGSFYRAIYLVARNNALIDNYVSNNTIYNGLVGIWMHSLKGNGAVHDNYILHNHIYTYLRQYINPLWGKKHIAVPHIKCFDEFCDFSILAC